MHAVSGTIEEVSERPAAAIPAGDRRSQVVWRIGFAAVIGVAAANFFWQLGSSSYYVDEVDSLNASLHPLSSFLHAVGTIEITPPAYFLLLHEWLYRLGSGTSWLHHLAVGHESLARAPSAVCGVLLVAVVYWLCSRVSARRATPLAAAALTALSPFVLQYSQLAQPYVFAAVAAAAAVAGALEAVRRPVASDPNTSRADPRWLAFSLLASVLALCLHYTAALVVVPLCGWLLSRQSLTGAWRLLFPGAIVLAGLALVPLLIEQHHAFPNRPGVAHSGAVSLTTVAAMIETPFNGRVQPLRGLGAAVVLGAFAVVLWRLRRGSRGLGRWLVVGLAGGGPLVLFLLSVAGGHSFWGHLMLPRYAAVAAPFMLVTVALALESLPLPAAVVLAGCALTMCVLGLAQSHRRQGFYLDARGVVQFIQPRIRNEDAVAVPFDPVARVPLAAYGLASRQPRVSGASAPAGPGGAPRVWVISEFRSGSSPSAPALARAYASWFGPFGDTVLAVRVFPGIPSVGVVAVVTRRRVR